MNPQEIQAPQSVSFSDRIANLLSPAPTSVPAPTPAKTEKTLSFTDRIYGLISDKQTYNPSEWESMEGNKDWEVKKPSPLGNLFGNKSEIRRKDYSFDRTDFTNRIVGVENQALVASGGDVYKSIGSTGDLGKYQASPATLADWSKAWLGKTYTKDQFMNDPKAQDTFFNEFQNMAEKYKLTPEEAAVAWHSGWGELGNTSTDRLQKFKNGLAERMQTEENKRYLNKFSTTTPITKK